MTPHQTTGTVDERLAATVRQLLLADGYSALTVEAVSASSGIAKTTIYRRWKSKPEMVFALMVDAVAMPPGLPDGTLEERLTMLAARTLQRMDNATIRAALPGIIADMMADQALKARLADQFLAPAEREIADLLTVAHRRGEIARADGAMVVHAILLGAAYSWTHLFHQGRPANLDHVIARACLEALRVSTLTQA
jgi:AcrR family transcriptional regulator